MIGMLLVNNSGDYAFAIWPLSESEWNGLSTADMVFPSFLFMTGMSI
jgi:predicted acyltransferase